MTDEREYDDMQRDTPDRERMEMSGTDAERSDEELNPAADRENMREANAVRADERTGTRAGMAPVAGAASGTAAQADLWPEMGDLRQKFDSIQSEFIDDPRSAVRKAEQLINEVVDRITRSMRERVDSMRSEAGKNADTEQLRQTMRGYRELVVWMDTRRAA